MKTFERDRGDRGREKTILVVDDDTITRRIAERNLRQDYAVYTCASGREALRLLPLIRPDLVLADLHMPEMNGLQLMEEIRALPDERLAQVSVVLMTSDVDTDNEVRGFDLGASDFIRKPLLSEVLSKRIARVIRNDAERQNLSLQAHFDELTGLLNRRAATQLIDRHIQMGQGVLLMLDIDRFKSINDRLGHQTGDRALCAVAEVLRHFVRSGDIVGRLGGDEFVIFYCGFPERSRVSERCRDICEQAREALYRIIGEDFGEGIGLSIGISFAPEDGEDFESLYRGADEAMYRVKQSGRGSFGFYDRRYAAVGEGHVSELLSRMEESPGRGAFEVRYEDFLSICRFLRRTAERDESRLETQLVLFTVHEGAENTVLLESLMQGFGRLLGQTIRRGDVYVRYSDTQYMALLIGADRQRAEAAVGRVLCGRIPPLCELRCEYDTLVS